MPMALRWLGYADLSVKFSDCFQRNFTLTARFMPQYGHTYRGPILPSGDGSFLVGQGNYREDTKKDVQAKADKLVLVVGGQARTYLLPQGDWQQRWYHLAVRADYRLGSV